jgi:hypothetical protein
MKVLKFNTGRLYTDKGQRIAAVRIDSETVAMYDIDRGIDFLLSIPELSEGEPLRSEDVMKAYDYGHIKKHTLCLMPEIQSMLFDAANTL